MADSDKETKQQGLDSKPKEKRPSRQGSQKEAADHDQDLLDEGIEESFPASDPPSVSHID